MQDFEMSWLEVGLTCRTAQSE